MQNRNSFLLSDRVRSWLEGVGWTETRKWNAASTVATLRTLRFSVNETATQTLENMGGLVLNLPHLGVARICIDPEEGLHTISPEQLELLSLAEEVRSEVCPVGAGSGYIMLACEDGKFILLHEQWFYCRVCPSVSDFFESLIFDDCSNCVEIQNIEDFQPEF